MKILVLSASVGSGHMRAAQAVAAAVEELDPSSTVRVVDCLELAPAAFRKAYGGGYMGLANSAPHLLGYLYDALDERHGSDRVRRLVEHWAMRALGRMLESEPWDAVIHTHFLPAQTLARLRTLGRVGVPHIVAVTDFEAHRFWVNPPCESYFVATKEGECALRSWGVPAERVTVSGIPIHPVFSRLPEKAAARDSLGLEGRRPLLLQLAGGSGVGPMRETFERLLALRKPVDIIAVAGRNERARADLASAPIPARHRVRVFGFTDKIHELMAAADLLVSKPGGLTTSEALAAGLPFVAVNPIPGQESRNCDYLLENGAGIKVNALSALTEKVEGLLTEPRRLSSMRAKAKKLGRPRSAFAVAQAALEAALDPASLDVRPAWTLAAQRLWSLISLPA